MREIPLTRGLKTKVDDADYDTVVANGPWLAAEINGIIVAARWSGAFSSRVLKSLQKFLMRPRKQQCVVHLNGDALDNRRENLKIARKGVLNASTPY